MRLWEKKLNKATRMEMEKEPELKVQLACKRWV